MNKKSSIQLCILLGAVFLGLPAFSAEVTTVTLTDEVIRKDCIPFGVNIIRMLDSLKKPIQVNFEGTNHRLALKGELYADGYLCYQYTSNQEKSSNKKTFWIGAKVTMLSGPAKGQSRTIKQIEFREVAAHLWEYQKKQKRRYAYFTFDKPLTGLPPETERVNYATAKYEKAWELGKMVGADPFKNVGVLLHKDYHVGYIDRQRGYRLGKNNKRSEAVLNDVPPGSFGNAALLVEDGEVSFEIGNHGYNDCNDIYKMDFWAKAGKGSSEIKITWDRLDQVAGKTIKPTSKWERYQLSFDLNGQFPDLSIDALAKKQLKARAVFEISGGEVHLDDIEMWREGADNPTDFLDDFVEELKDANVSTLRMIQEGGDSPHNVMQERMKQRQFDCTMVTDKGKSAGVSSWFMRNRTFTMPELYRLCEYLGCDPWYSLPGTIYVEEMDAYMEYLGAPADVGYGKLRAEQGHPKPWTDTLGTIYVEFANEIWNTAGDYPVSSYDGRDYWDDLIRRAKASPYYRGNIVFIMGTAGKTEYVKEADLYMTRAPYVVHDLPPKILEVCGDTKGLFRWFFANSQDSNWDGKVINFLYKTTQKMGRGIGVYEVNYHVKKPKSTEKEQKHFVHSVAAGVNILNAMLGQVERFGAQPQCIFDYCRMYFHDHLFGGVITHKKGKQRYRPTWLAFKEVNRALKGDLLKTEQTGTPTFKAKRGKKSSQLSEGEYDSIYSYAFKDGSRYSLILINIDLDQDLQVKIEFPGKSLSGAEQRVLSGTSYDANNEIGHDPLVTVETGRLKAFKTGNVVTLPAASMMTLSWETK